jgi:uncharacterized protein YrrD
MRIELGSKVQTTDGHRAGHIKQAIWDPKANQVIGYVIDTGGLLGHDVVISPEMIETAKGQGDAIVISLDKKELDELARYEPTAYADAPAGWLPPDVYGFPAAGYLWPVAPADEAAPPEPDGVERLEPKLKEGMKVRDANGHEIGVIEEIRVDSASGELRGIVVRRGALAKLARAQETVEIGPDQIGTVDRDEVRLVTSGREIFEREHA